MWTRSTGSIETSANACQWYAWHRGRDVRCVATRCDALSMCRLAQREQGAWDVVLNRVYEWVKIILPALAVAFFTSSIAVILLAYMSKSQITARLVAAERVLSNSCRGLSNLLRTPFRCSRNLHLLVGVLISMHSTATAAVIPPQGMLVLKGDSPASTCVDPKATTVNNTAIATMCCKGSTCMRRHPSDSSHGCVAGVWPSSFESNTWKHAQIRCSELGLTLCGQNCQGYGCNYDRIWVWTSLPCPLPLSQHPKENKRGAPSEIDTSLHSPHVGAIRAVHGAHLDRGRIRLASGNNPDPVRQDYDYVARSQDSSISRFGRCMGDLRKRGVATLLASEIHVTSAERLPPSTGGVKGGWKKLVAILEAAKHADIVVWHDGDAVPTASGRLIERVRHITAKQPHVALWLQPSGSLLRHLAPTQWQHDFGGVSLDSVRSNVLTSNDVQSGVMVVRSSHAALFADTLRLYDAQAEARGLLVDHLISLGVPKALSGLQEQGPLTHMLLQNATAAKVRLVPWLQCQARLADCDRPASQPTAFVHYAGCTFDSMRAQECLHSYCAEWSRVNESIPTDRTREDA